MIKKELAISNVSDAPQKKRLGIGYLCSVLLRYLHPDKLFVDRYSNKDKLDVLGGIIITRRNITTVIIREQLCIFMKHESFGDH